MARCLNLNTFADTEKNKKKEINYKKMRENVKNQFFSVFSVKWI